MVIGKHFSQFTTEDGMTYAFCDKETYDILDKNSEIMYMVSEDYYCNFQDNKIEDLFG